MLYIVKWKNLFLDKKFGTCYFKNIKTIDLLIHIRLKKNSKISSFLISVIGNEKPLMCNFTPLDFI